MPGKKSKPKSKPKKTAARPVKAKALKPSAGANLECAECNGLFTAAISPANVEKEMGKKFSCPSCGALYEIISLQESRITVTILAKGETRTYGKTYDLATNDYARPL